MTRPAPALRWVATCARGLEEILRAELRSAGFDLGETASPPAADPRSAVKREAEDPSLTDTDKDTETKTETTTRKEKDSLKGKDRPGRRAGGAEIGGVVFRGDLQAGVRANWRLRTANRVLLELASWPAPDDEALYRGARLLLSSPATATAAPARSSSAPAPPDSAEGAFPFSESFPSWLRTEPTSTRFVAELLAPERTFSITATSSRSRIRDTRWIALKVKDGIVDAQRERFGRRATIARDEPDSALRLRLFDDRATLLLDTSGEPLDRRGYRLATTAAPLREQLAAAAILASGWDGRGPVVDPMCGSGTLLAEAGAISAGLAPNRLRAHWAFDRLPGFDPALLTLARAEPFPAADPESALVGADLDAAAIDAARVNLRAAGLEARASLAVADGHELEPPPGPGLVAVNPPYGDRLSEAPAQWRRLGDLLKQRYRGWRAVVVAGDAELGKQIGLRPARRIPVWNGPLEARILVFELY